MCVRACVCDGGRGGVCVWFVLSFLFHCLV